MYKGIVKSIIPSGVAFIECDGKPDVFCPKVIVEKHNLSKGDIIEFTSKQGQKSEEVVQIIKHKKQKTLSDYALKVNELSAEEYEEFCNLTQKYVRDNEFRNNITTSKIRNIFSAIQKANTILEIKKLRPKLAYLSGRDGKTKFFMNELDSLIQKISNEKELLSFKDFFEAIVCYKKEIE